MVARWCAGPFGMAMFRHSAPPAMSRGRPSPDRQTVGAALADEQQRREVRLEMSRHVPTYTPKPGEVTRAWHVIDADDIVLGRLASSAAQLLRGKHKPQFAPHVDTGDFVVIVNAEKVAISGAKRDEYRYRHSGYPGGLSRRTVGELLETKPERVVELAVRGMLPKNTLGRKQLKKLKVYAGPEHPHAAQKPQPFEIKQVAQ
jgi:large subunit ribosomal protein L13